MNTSSHTPAPPHALTGVLIRMVLCCALWGGTFIAGRYLALRMPHFSAAALRFLFALIGLGLYVKVCGARLPRLTREQMLLTFGLGTTGIFLYNACFFAGLGILPASRAALMIAASPVLTFCCVQWIERARWSYKATLGVLTSFMGAVLVVTRGDFSVITGKGALGMGELYLLGAVCVWVIYTLLIRYRGRGLAALPMTFYATAWGTLLLGIPALAEWKWTGNMADMFWPSATEWAAIAYLGLLGTSLAFVWYGQAVAAIGAARATQFTNLVPVFGVLFGALILGEPLYLSSLTGGVMVIFGVLLAGRAKMVRKSDSAL